jgi:hypothetical protein
LVVVWPLTVVVASALASDVQSPGWPALFVEEDDDDDDDVAVAEDRTVVSSARAISPLPLSSAAGRPSSAAPNRPAASNRLDRTTSMSILFLPTSGDPVSELVLPM